MKEIKEDKSKVVKVQLKKQYPRSIKNEEKLKQYLKEHDTTKDSAGR